jgi:cysteine desulfurase
MKKVYLDHNATTPVHEKILSQSEELLVNWGNASSIHWASRKSKHILRDTRKKLSDLLTCQPQEIIFTSGASESNTAIIMSVWSKFKDTNRKEFITTNIEHPSVLNTFKAISELGAIVHYIDVDLDGQFDFNHYRRVLSENTALVSIMLANNETGLLLPLTEIATLAKEKNALVHSDMVQAFSKVQINLSDLKLDYASFSAHKFYALKGTGFLYAKKGVPFSPLIYGGGQERGRRGGTENNIGISALGIVLDNWSDVFSSNQKTEVLRNYLQDKILSEISGVIVNHKNCARLPNTLSVVIDGVDGESLLMSLDLNGYAVSTGAACSSGNPTPSKTLLSIGLSHRQAQSSLRVSLGKDNTSEEINNFCNEIIRTVGRLRHISKSEESSELYL